MIRTISTFLAVLIAGTLTAAEADVRIENASLEVIVSPEKGRIMSFRRKSGKNLLWTNRDGSSFKFLRGWINHGGDKVWLVPQLQRHAVFGNKLPDPDLDGKSWQVVEQTETSVTIRSRLSEKLGVRITRKLVLENGPVLRIENTLSREKSSPLPLNIWQVSQVVRPEYALLGIDRTFNSGGKAFFKHRQKMSRSRIEEKKDHLKIMLPKDDWDKINAWGEWMAAVFKDEIFLQYSTLVPDAPYCENSSIQIYGNDQYMEMETLSPMVYLKKGETYHKKIIWTVLDRKKSDDRQLTKDFLNKYDSRYLQ